MAGPEGFEPPACRLGGGRSIQLSYGPGAVLILARPGDHGRSHSRAIRINAAGQIPKTLLGDCAAGGAKEPPEAAVVRAATLQLRLEP